MHYVHTNADGDRFLIDHDSLTIDDGVATSTARLPDGTAGRVLMARAILHDTGACVTMSTDTAERAVPDTDRPDLDAIAARADAASEGPWESFISQHGDLVITNPAGDCIADLGHPGDADIDRDAEFITAARQNVPSLVGEVRRLTAERDQARMDLRMVVERDEQIVQDAREEERDRCADALWPDIEAAGDDDDGRAVTTLSRAQDVIRALSDAPDEGQPADAGWDAVYEPGNVSTHHIGRYATQDDAKAAAESWYHDSTLDDRGPLAWERLRGTEGWRLIEQDDPHTESDTFVRFAGHEGLFLCPSCGTNQPLASSRRRDDVGQRWCWICDDATPEQPAETPAPCPVCGRAPADQEYGPDGTCRHTTATRVHRTDELAEPADAPPVVWHTPADPDDPEMGPHVPHEPDTD